MQDIVGKVQDLITSRITIFGAPSNGLSLAKFSAEKTKYTDKSQPPNSGDERNRGKTDAKRRQPTLTDSKPTLDQR